MLPDQLLDMFGVKSPRSLVGAAGEAHGLPGAAVCVQAEHVQGGTWIFTSDIMMTASAFPKDWAQEPLMRAFRLRVSSVLMYTSCISSLNLPHNPFSERKKNLLYHVCI